jgi:hypothetical protein
MKGAWSMDEIELKEELSSGKYKSNSHRSKELSSDKRVEKVISSVAKTKNKSELLKLADVFIAEDVSAVKSHIIFDIVIPYIKKMLYDSLTGGAGMLIYGDSKPPVRNNSPREFRSYEKDYERKNLRRPQKNTIYSCKDIYLESRRDAEAVLDQMDDLIEKYGYVSVADLYNMVGFTEEYTDYDYGWISISSAKVINSRDGYMLKLPRAMPLDNRAK